ncbi:serine/threonine protein kinase [Rhodoferax ferrireducens]|uniref:serine/threonine protein kinase n=1 Tax=Rhodoferax ferrireducens TaxID=192843 RepID=UPI001E63C9C1|nr:serine/threonine protein kinase [Rhodoferax ferrireducens]
MDQPKEKSDSDETRLLTNLGHQAKSATTDGQKSDAPAEPESKSERIKGVGDTLNGRFVLEECLGFGGMGMVYKALDLRKLEASDRKPYIAIKVLNVQFRGHPKSLIALQREAKKAQSLAHPNIVTVYDFDRDGAMVYLTMELLSGRSLQNLLHDPDFKGLSFAEALPIITGMAKALAHAHERGFVHCDLKPANVFLTDTGDVKVIDFGIARVFRKSEEDLEATVFDPGSLGGMTPTYASAEMLEHRDPDPRDDIYALGCITYELLTGRHPFNRSPATQARGAGLKLQRPKDLGHRQWQALREALAFDREKRTLTVPQFLHGIAGQHHPESYVALAGGAIVITLLLVAAVANKWESMRHSGNITKVTEEPPVASMSAVPASEKAPQARESVAAVLASIPCSALTKSADGSGTLVQGYLAEDANLAQLKERLGAADGVNNLKLNVRQVNKDYCPVISALAPYWRSNQETGGATSIHTKGNNEKLIEGDSLIMNITTPGYDSYVNIDYYVLDGSVVHLVPSPRAKANQAPSNYTATIGSPGSWVVSKPFGSELIALLITPVPLFDNIRPEHESRAAYLQAIEQRLKEIVAKYGPERLSADFVQLTTSPKP